MTKKVAKKKYKEGCGFRKHLRLCKFPVDHCRPPAEGSDYGEVCHLYGLDWDAKKLKAHGKLLTKDMLELEKTLKGLKQSDREQYKHTKKLIRDMFEGCVMIGKAILFIKRTGGTFNKQKKVADKLVEKLKCQ